MTERHEERRREEDKAPMTPEKIQEHEPTAVHRNPSDQKIVEKGHEGSNPEKAKEILRSKGMAKGTAGTGETADEYEQGSAGNPKA